MVKIVVTVSADELDTMLARVRERRAASVVRAAMRVVLAEADRLSADAPDSLSGPDGPSPEVSG